MDPFDMNLRAAIRLTAAAAAVGLLAPSCLHAQSIVNLGVLQADHTESYGISVSGNGSVAAGVSAVGYMIDVRSFRWQNGARTDIGDGGFPGPRNVVATSVSADGVWVAGTSYGDERAVPFRWSQAGGMEDLGNTPGGLVGGDVNGISGDGSVVVGMGRNEWQAFRWTSAGGIQNLGTLPGGTYSSGQAVSANGQVITGFSGTEDGDRAFVWTESGGMVALPLISGEEYARGFALSADGSVIVGNDNDLAARWENGVGEYLPSLPGATFSIAYAISGDGSMIGGISDSVNRALVATVWSDSLGALDLNTYLPGIGIDLTGWQLREVTGISQDGTTLVGRGKYYGEERGWLVAVPAPGPCEVFCIAAVVLGRRRRRV